MRVEDPEPQIGDSAIEVKVVAKPAPVVKDHVNTWNLTVPASGKSVIDYPSKPPRPRTCALSRKVEKVGGETFFKKLPLPKPLPLPANSLTPSF